MTAVALLLVLLGAACHATWNLLAKKAGGGDHFALLGALLVCLVWAPVVLWHGAGPVLQWGAAEWSAVVASAAIHVVYFGALLRGYAASDLGVVYPVARGSGPLLASVGAVLVLGERWTPQGVLGALAIVAGVFAIAGGPSLWRRAHDPAQWALVLRGIGWGLFTGVTIAAYTVVDGVAVKVLAMSPVLLVYMGNVLRVGMMLPLLARDRPGFVASCRLRWRAALAFAVLSPLAYVLVLFAVTLAPLSLVAPAREVSMLFAALLGGTLLGEGDRGLRLVGAGCIAGGVVLLAAG